MVHGLLTWIACALSSLWFDEQIRQLFEIFPWTAWRFFSVSELAFSSLLPVTDPRR